MRTEHHWLRMCYARLGHLFSYLPKQPGYHKRLKAAAPLLAAAIDHLARSCPSCSRCRAACPAASIQPGLSTSFKSTSSTSGQGHRPP